MTTENTEPKAEVNAFKVIIHNSRTDMEIPKRFRKMQDKYQDMSTDEWFVLFQTRHQGLLHAQEHQELRVLIAKMRAKFSELTNKTKLQNAASVVLSRRSEF
jgi:hypothetical protein